MNKLNRYFFYKISINTLIILFSITLLLFILQASKFLDLVIGRGISIKYLGYISLLTMPTVLNEMAPIAIFIAILFTWQLMQNNNEIVIMQTLGLSPWQISKPALIIGLFTTLLCLSLSSFIISNAQVKYFEVQEKIKSDFNLKIIKANNFIQLTPKITIYIQSVKNGNLLQNVLIDNEKDFEETITIYAQEATLIKEQNNQIKLLLRKGSIQQLNKKTNYINFVNFDIYILDINNDSEVKGNYKNRTSPRQMYLWELLNYNNLNFMKKLKKENILSYNKYALSYIKEINKRVVNCVLAILLPLIACFFFSKASFNRNYQYMTVVKSFIVGITIKILCTTFLLTSTSLLFIILFYSALIIFGIYIIIKINKKEYFKYRIT